MRDDPYLFEVGALALAFTDTPVSEYYLDYVRDAIQGEIEGIIPNSALIGTYHILRSVYNYSKEDAENVVSNITRSSRISWYGKIMLPQTKESLAVARRNSIDGWDGYYVEIARETGATILTIDDDFDDIPGVDSEILLDKDDFEALNNYLKEKGLVS